MTEEENKTSITGLTAEENAELDMYKRTLISVIEAENYPKWQEMTDEQRMEVVETINRMANDSQLFQPRAFSLVCQQDEDGYLFMTAVPCKEIVNTET